MTLTSLGRVNVAVPGTPVQITSNTTASANTIVIQSLPGLTSKIYIGKQGMNKTTLSGVCRILAANPSGGLSDSFVLVVNDGNNELMPSEYYIDTDVANEGALVSYWTA